MNPFFRRLRWLVQRPKTRKPSCARSFSFTWRKTPTSVEPTAWRRTRPDGRRAVSWAT